jgi:hypothetical protein
MPPDRLWSPPSPLSMGNGGPFPRSKASGRETVHSPLSSAESKNAWSYTSTPRTSSWRGAVLITGTLHFIWYSFYMSRFTNMAAVRNFEVIPVKLMWYSCVHMNAVHINWSLNCVNINLYICWAYRIIFFVVFEQWTLDLPQISCSIQVVFCVSSTRLLSVTKSTFHVQQYTNSCVFTAVGIHDALRFPCIITIRDTLQCVYVATWFLTINLTYVFVPRTDMLCFPGQPVATGAWTRELSGRWNSGIQLGNLGDGW